MGDLSSLKFMWLHGNQLTGAIPSRLGSLANLQRLYLSENQLDGDIPAELDNLADTLTHWRLAGNQLTGCVPVGLAGVHDNDLESLGLEICGDSRYNDNVFVLPVSEDLVVDGVAIPLPLEEYTKRFYEPFQGRVRLLVHRQELSLWC